MVSVIIKRNIMADLAPKLHPKFPNVEFTIKIHKTEAFDLLIDAAESPEELLVSAYVDGFVDASEG